MHQRSAHDVVLSGRLYMYTLCIISAQNFSDGRPANAPSIGCPLTSVVWTISLRLCADKLGSHLTGRLVCKLNARSACCASLLRPCCLVSSGRLYVRILRSMPLPSLRDNAFASVDWLSPDSDLVLLPLKCSPCDASWSC